MNAGNCLLLYNVLCCDFKFPSGNSLFYKWSNSYSIFSIGSAISKRSRDYWQSKPPSVCIGEPALLNPSKYFCPELAVGVFCMSTSTSSRGQPTPTHWGHLGNWVIETRRICTGVIRMTVNNTKQLTVSFCNSVYSRFVVPRQFPTVCTCIILEGKHTSALAVIILKFP